MSAARRLPAADIDALLRSYGGAPSRTTVTKSNPPGLTLFVDGVRRRPATFDQPTGELLHRVWAADGPQIAVWFSVCLGRWSR